MKVKIKKATKKSLKEINTNVSGFYQDREGGEPTPESFAGPEMFVLLSDGYDDAGVFGVFDSLDAAVAAAQSIVESGGEDTPGAISIIKLKSNMALEVAAPDVKRVVSKGILNR